MQLIVRLLTLDAYRVNGFDTTISLQLHSDMDVKQLTILKRGADVWNSWRQGLRATQSISQNPIVSNHKPRADEGIIVDLSYADLRNCQLQGSDLSAANLSFANVCGLDLSKTNLNGAELQFVEYDNGTIWPTGYELPSTARRSIKKIHSKQKIIPEIAPKQSNTTETVSYTHLTLPTIYSV